MIQMNKFLYIWLNHPDEELDVIPCFTGKIWFKSEDNQRKFKGPDIYLFRITADSFKDIEDTIKVLVNKFEQFKDYNFEKILDFETSIKKLKKMPITRWTTIEENESNHLVDINQYLIQREFRLNLQKNILENINFIEGVHPIHIYNDPVDYLDKEISEIKQNFLLIEKYEDRCEKNKKLYDAIKKFLAFFIGLFSGFLLNKIL